MPEILLYLLCYCSASPSQRGTPRSCGENQPSIWARPDSKHSCELTWSSEVSLFYLFIRKSSLPTATFISSLILDSHSPGKKSRVLLAQEMLFSLWNLILLNCLMFTVWSCFSVTFVICLDFPLVVPTQAIVHCYLLLPNQKQIASQSEFQFFYQLAL